MLVEIDSNIAALRALLAAQLRAEARQCGSMGFLYAMGIF
jgi:hypothetical protein